MLPRNTRVAWFRFRLYVRVIFGNGIRGPYLGALLRTLNQLSSKLHVVPYGLDRGWIGVESFGGRRRTNAD